MVGMRRVWLGLKGDGWVEKDMVWMRRRLG